jgi:type VI protein secretion system component Hcp
VLALQRTVGNRAVGAMLARDATTAEAEPADAKSPGGSRAAIEMGSLGKIALDSWSLATSGGAGSPGGGGHRGSQRPQDMSLQSQRGKHSPKLAEAVVKGTHYESAVIDAGHVVYRMGDVIVSSYQPGGGEKPDEDGSGPESWSINFAKFEPEYRKKDE